MKNVRIISFIIYFFLIGILSVWAQNSVQFTVRYPSHISEGESFEIIFNLNSRGGSQFQAPTFKGFDILYGPSQSQSSNISIINGTASQSFSFSYSYGLLALKTGSYNLGKASISVDGKKYESNPINITVVKGNPQNPSGEQKNTQNQNISSSDLFIRANTNKSKAYQGEEVLLTYKIYTSVPVSQYNIFKIPTGKGFWTEELKDAPAQQQKNEVIDGKRYLTADIRKIAIFPQTSGKLNIEPMEIEAIAQVQAAQRPRSGNIFDFFDDPFFAPVTNIQKMLKSNSVSLTVLPFPENGKPISFNGLTGNYTCKWEYDKTKKLQANHAITMRFTVQGEGNISLIQAPELVFPPDFDVYEPKITTDITAGYNGVSGKRVFEYIVVPRNAGIYTIPAFSYSFFNPKQERYTDNFFEDIVLNIAPSDGKNHTNTSPNNSSLTLLNRDIEYIASNSKWIKKGNTFFLSPFFFGCLALCLLAFLILLLYQRKRIKRAQDIVGTKNKQALKKAKKCLRKAEKFLKNEEKDAFYIEISQALWGFIGEKLNISTVDLSLENIEKTLLEKNVNEELIQAFLDTLHHCEYERFAPQGNSLKSMKDLYQEAFDVICKSVNELK